MTNMKKEINAYWAGRAEGYSAYNNEEMRDSRRELWREELLRQLSRHFSGRGREEIRILDAGTGPGFFAILLCEAGFEVTALDGAEEMLREARKNAGSLSGRITWVQGDTQELPFEEGSFDAVVTRNVTWNLPDPEKAYGEWYRVLKDGGLLLNFDADWYGHLFDEEKKKGFLKDRANVKEGALEDLYNGAGTDNEKMEELARRMPLSREKRPSWDLEAMKAAGFFYTESDEGTWKRVWNRVEIVNNSSTPVFLVKGVKGKRPDLLLCNAAVAGGEKWEGELCISREEGFYVPAAVFHGKLPGKTVIITAGMHGPEYVGIQAAIELSAKLDPEKVRGTIVILKTVDREAFENRRGTPGREDRKNLNQAFPGDRDGSRTEKLAFYLAELLVKNADYYMDLRGGDEYEQLTPHVYYAGAAEPETVAGSRSMAEQVDVPYMVRSLVSSGGAYNYTASKGIPSISLNRGGQGLWSSEESRSTRRDVRNILCHLGCYLGQKDLREYYPMEVADICYLAASHKGMWYPAKNAGDLVRKNDNLGEIRDYCGNVKEVFTAEENGVILRRTSSLQVPAESSVVVYGRICYQNDERKERIVRYWGKRSESFLEQKRRELHSYMAEQWLQEIEAQLPVKPNLRILDVGCGTGFFSILLDKMGHRVIGIDLTPEMIRNAKRLAKEEDSEARFRIMDAEKLDFPNDYFDVVISRNLTWTLPHAEIAYQEWKRVLKKGGLLLNFDANYGLSNFTEYGDLPEDHAHFDVGDEMLKECEEIKRQLPISSCSRPAWDLQVLGQMHLEQFTIDLGISERLYSKKDEFYNPTPIFMLVAVK